MLTEINDAILKLSKVIDYFSVASLKAEVSLAHFPYYGFHLKYLYKMNQEVTRTTYELL